MKSALKWKRQSLLLLLCMVAPSDQFVAPQRTLSVRSAVDVTSVSRFAARESGLHLIQSTVDDEECVIIHDGTALNAEIRRLCEASLIDDAMELLTSAREDALINNSSSDLCSPDTESFNIILSSLSRQILPDWERIDRIFQNQIKLAKKHPRVSPNGKTYEAVIAAYSKSSSPDACKRCVELLSYLLSKYKESGKSVNNVGLSFSCFIGTLLSLANSGGGWRAAEKAQKILNEMELLSRNDESLRHLAPDITCYNIVLNAWSKSGAKNACERCETLLQTMEKMSSDGLTKLQPDTVSYNTLLDAVAYSRDRDAAQKAESILQRMDELSKMGVDCEPDIISFNCVLNAWSRSRDLNAASRASSILRHMEERYERHNTYVQPDSMSYHAVIAAWARSKKKNSIQMAKQTLERMEEAFQNGNSRAEPSTISYNILISALASSRDSSSADYALELLDLMKTMGTQKGRLKCAPDCVTYTTVMGVLAKHASDADIKSIELLEALEAMHCETGDRSLKPTIKTFTTVIHAIARSGRQPERAENIVERIEKAYDSGESDIQADCVCYDALINAYGWSDTQGKAMKCYSIYQKMRKLYRTHKNRLAKPDIVTCNSVLNACVHEHVDTDDKREEIMDIVVQTVKDFESNAPEYGWPDHVTFFTTIQAINKHVLDMEKRAQLAEATFWQCCNRGQASVPVIFALHQSLPWDRFSEIMGASLQSGRNETLSFDWTMIPKAWRQFAPEPKHKRQSMPSRKRGRMERQSAHRLVRGSQPR